MINSKSLPNFFSEAAEGVAGVEAGAGGGLPPTGQLADPPPIDLCPGEEIGGDLLPALGPGPDPNCWGKGFRFVDISKLLSRRLKKCVTVISVSLLYLELMFRTVFRYKFENFLELSANPNRIVHKQTMLCFRGI